MHHLNTTVNIFKVLCFSLLLQACTPASARSWRRRAWSRLAAACPVWHRARHILSTSTTSCLCLWAQIPNQRSRTWVRASAPPAASSPHRRVTPQLNTHCLIRILDLTGTEWAAEQGFYIFIVVIFKAHTYSNINWSCYVNSAIYETLWEVTAVWSTFRSSWIMKEIAVKRENWYILERMSCTAQPVGKITHLMSSGMLKGSESSIFVNTVQKHHFIFFCVFYKSQNASCASCWVVKWE